MLIYIFKSVDRPLSHRGFPRGPGDVGGWPGFGGGQGPQLPPILFYLLLFQGLAVLFLLLWQWCLQQLRKILAYYNELRSQMGTPPKDPTKLQKWLEKSRFEKLTDLLVAVTTLMLTPELFSSALANISNRWAKALLRVIVPLLRFLTSVALFLGTSAISLKGIAFFYLRIKRFYQSLWQFVPTGSVTNGPVMFLELLLKAILGGFYAGIICRSLFKSQWGDKQQNLLAVGSTGICGIGIYFVAKDTSYFLKIAQQIIDTQVGAFFLNSQLGRLALILGCTQALGALEELPYSMYFYLFFLCIFNLYGLAFTATSNLF